MGSKGTQGFFSAGDVWTIWSSFEHPGFEADGEYMEDQGKEDTLLRARTFEILEPVIYEGSYYQEPLYQSFRLLVIIV